MKDELKCPFAEPVPPGRKTKGVPRKIRKELVELDRKKSEFTGQKILRDPTRRGTDENFRGYFAASSAINDRVNEIEVDLLKRPQQARIAYHADWKYSIETPGVLAAELRDKPPRRISALEQIIETFGSKDACIWPFKKKAPARIETFDVPADVRNLLVLAEKWEKAAAKLVGDNGGCNDGGMWLRRHTIGDAIGYFANDFVRAVHDKSDRYSVDYWAGFKCSFSIT